MTQAEREAVGRRQQEALDRCTTDVQRERCHALHAQGKATYPVRRKGVGVVAEFRRYVETGDAGKIGPGLYDLSTSGAGGFNDIAHFDLNGYRFHSYHVYTDGMTSGEVADAILKIAQGERGRLEADLQAKVDAARLAEAQRLATLLGMRLEPADGTASLQPAGQMSLTL